MSSHLQTYSSLSSPSPSPDDNSYTVLPGQTPANNDLNNNINGIGNNNNLHQHHHHHNHHHHHHHNNNNNNTNNNTNNNNNNANNNNNSNNNIQLDDRDNFHNINTNTMKYCAGCGGKILDRFFLHALDRYWHNSCLKCYCCGAMLGDIGSSCYTKAGMILCKSDYTRMFGTAPCTSCGQIIAANEFVMRTASSSQSHNLNHSQISSNENHHNKYLQNHLENYVYHLKCFVCSKCSSQLRPGDRYYMLAGSLVCEQDWLKLIKTSSTASPPIRKGKVGRPRRSRE